MPAFSRGVLLTDRGVGGVERGIIAPVYSGFEVDGEGVSRVGVGKDKGLGTGGTVGTVGTAPSFCFVLLTYTSRYLDSP